MFFAVTRFSGPLQGPHKPLLRPESPPHPPSDSAVVQHLSSWCKWQKRQHLLRQLVMMVADCSEFHARELLQAAVTRLPTHQLGEFTKEERARCLGCSAHSQPYVQSYAGLPEEVQQFQPASDAWKPLVNYAIPLEHSKWEDSPTGYHTVEPKELQGHPKSSILRFLPPTDFSRSVAKTLS